MPTKRLTKRPRGRPPKDPALKARYRRATVRLCADGTPVKPAVRVNAAELEAWLEAHAGEFWRGRGRPPAGQTSWATAAMKRFDISRRTLLRLVALINRRRERASATAANGLSGAQASLLAALAESYRSAPRNAPLSGPGNASAKIIPSQAAGAQRSRTNTGTSSTGPLVGKIHPADIREAVIAALRAASEPQVLHQFQEVIAARQRALGVAEPQAAVAAAGGGGLDALGLRVVAPAAQRPIAAPKPGADAITESLLEAIDAAESMGSMPAPALALAKQLRQHLNR